MTKWVRTTGILLEAVAILCFGLCIFREGQDKAYLAFGLLCNALAFLLYHVSVRKS